MYACSFNNRVVSYANSLKDLFSQIQHILPEEVLKQLPPTEPALRAHSNQNSPALTVAKIKTFNVSINTEAGPVQTTVVFQQWKHIRLHIIENQSEDE